MKIVKKVSLLTILCVATAVQAAQQSCDATALFQLSKAPSTHKNQVNTFSTIEDVYKAYESNAQNQAFQLAVPPLNRDQLHKIGHNEIMATLQYQEEINGKLRALIAGHGWKPTEQFASFRKLFLAKNEAEISKLKKLASEVLAWQGFALASQPNQLGLEFFTEWTHTGSRLIDNLNAFFFAQFLGEACTPDAHAWEQFTQTPEFKKTAPFAMLIGEIVTPISAASVGADQEGMSISAALQDFRRKKPENFVLPAQASAETEKLFAQKFEIVKAKFEKAQNVVDSYASVEDAYRDLKANPQGKMAEPNNIRREIGGTGFLIALQQAIKTELISEKFYLQYKDFIDQLVKLTNAMDKNNFEINLAFGTYEGDAIPSPYAFFEKLSTVNEHKK